MPRPLLLALTLTLLTACGSRTPDPAPAPMPVPAETAPDASERTPPIAVETPVDGTSGETGAGPARPPGPAPVQGVDYTRIEPAAPAQPIAGKVEVVEVFGYTCPACASVQPHVNAWKARQPPQVHFIYVPAAFGGFWTPYARAYYTAEAMGVLDATHDAMFHALHVERALPIDAHAAPRIAEWYGRHGIDPAVFASTMDSFAVNAKIARSQQLLQRWGIDATPTFVVAGKYKVMATREGGLEGLFRTIDWLVASEHAAQAP